MVAPSVAPIGTQCVAGSVLNRKPVAGQLLDEIKVIAVAQATRQANLLHRTSFLPLMSGRVAPATEVPKERTVWNARHQLALKRDNASLRADRATSRALRRDGDNRPSTATLSRRKFLSYAAQTVFDFWGQAVVYEAPEELKDRLFDCWWS